MKKIRVLLILTLVLSMMLVVGCSNNNDENNEKTNANNVNANATNDTVGDDTDAEVAKLDYVTGILENGYFENITAGDLVTLGEYKNLLIPTDVHMVPEDVVQSSIQTILADFTETVVVTDRAILDGDTVNIDYIGSVDGVEFEGGSTGGNGTEVTIGVTSYIDDFLQQLIGHTPGESFDIQVTFPEDYGQEHLNGKEATFAITVNHIAESILPEMTDEFVSTNLNETFEVNTVEELNTYVMDTLQSNSIKNYLQNYLANELEVAEVPEAVLEYQQLVFLNDYSRNATQYGMTVEEFVTTVVGIESVDALLETANEDMISSARFMLAIQAIAEDTELEVTDEHIKAYFLEFTGSEDYSAIANEIGLPYLKHVILQEVILDYLIENAVNE